MASGTIITVPDYRAQPRIDNLMRADTASLNKPGMNYAPANLNPEKDLPTGFLEFLLPLHQQFSPWQQELIAKRAEVLQASHRGQAPDYLPSSEAKTSDWRIEVPDWCADQRNQMTGPADDAELTVKLLNSGSPAVMIDLEDSTANLWNTTCWRFKTPSLPISMNSATTTRSVEKKVYRATLEGKPSPGRCALAVCMLVRAELLSTKSCPLRCSTWR